nr:hypothetical protein [Desulfobulbaceae bacterium]
MNERIDSLLEKIKTLQAGLHIEFEEELKKAQKKLNYSFQKNKIIWEKKALQAQKEFKENLYKFFRNSNILFMITSPIIYSLIIPLVFLDLFISVYQALCFPLYGITKVKRSDYLIIDRHHLAYLNIIEKLNCIYCGYGNGLLSYGMEIASRTEEFWCPIKHARKVKDVPPRYHHYANFGDAEKYRQKIQQMRERKSL